MVVNFGITHIYVAMQKKFPKLIQKKSRLEAGFDQHNIIILY